MSKKIIQLSIPKPCSEKWNEMTPIEKGRFCSVCERNLIDFTHFSDDELLSFVKNNNHKICGRFTKNQLDRKIESTSISENKIIQYSKVAGFVLPSLIANEVFSQVSYFEKETPLPLTRKDVVFDDTTKQKTDLNLKRKIEYNFLILEKTTNEPIPSVYLYSNEEIIGISDSIGNINVKVEKPLSNLIFVDSTNNFFEKEIDVSPANGLINNIIINLSPIQELQMIGMIYLKPKWWQFRRRFNYWRMSRH